MNPEDPVTSGLVQWPPPQNLSAADLTAFLFFYATGFAVDAFFFPGGLDASTTAAAFGAGGVAVFRAASPLSRLRERRRARRSRESLRRRVEAFRSLVEATRIVPWKGDKNYDALIVRLAQFEIDLDLWDKGLVGDKQLEGTLSGAIQVLREVAIRAKHSPAVPPVRASDLTINGKVFVRERGPDDSDDKR